MNLKFGVSVMSVDPPSEFVALVKEVEEYGFDYMWVCDSSLHSRDIFSYLTLCTVNTTRITLGTNILNPLTRHPGLSVRGVATLDEISNGRVIMGVGRGAEPLHELGLEYASLASVREMIEVTRRLLAGEVMDFEGSTFRLTGARLRYKLRSRIPVYVAATGPKMLELAGEVGDGVWMHVGPDLRCVQFALDRVRAGAARAGRAPEAVDASLFVFYAAEADRARAFEAARLGATYLLTVTPHYPRLIGMREEDARRLKAAYAGTHFHEAKEAARLTTDDLVDAMTLSGTVDDVIRKLERVITLGIRHVDLFPMGGNTRAQVRTFAEKVLPRFK